MNGNPIIDDCQSSPTNIRNWDASHFALQRSCAMSLSVTLVNSSSGNKEANR